MNMWEGLGYMAMAGASAYGANSASNAAAAGISGNIDANREMYRFNREEAQTARDWSLYLSNSATQRKALDLEAAGYNPILSGNPGQAASTPNSAQARSGNVIAQPASNPDVVRNSALLDFVGSALSVRQKTEQTRKESALADIAESRVPTSKTKESFLEGLWKGISNAFGMDYEEMGEKSVLPLAVGAAGVAGAKGLNKVLSIPIRRGKKAKKTGDFWKPLQRDLKNRSTIRKSKVKWSQM